MGFDACLDPKYCVLYGPAESVPMIPAVLALMLFAVSAVSARRSVGFLGSAGANFWRQTLSVSLLCVLALWWGGGLTGPCLVWFFWSGAIGYGVGDTGVFMALPRLGSRLTSLMTQCLAAPIGVGIEWAWLGYLPSWAQTAAGMIILLGVAVALAPKRGESALLPGGRTGVIFGLIAAGGQAGGAVLSRYGFEFARLEATPANPMTVSFQEGRITATAFRIGKRVAMGGRQCRGGAVFWGCLLSVGIGESSNC